MGWNITNSHATDELDITVMALVYLFPHPQFKNMNFISYFQGAKCSTMASSCRVPDWPAFASIISIHYRFSLTSHFAEKVNSISISNGMCGDGGQFAIFSRPPVHPRDCSYSWCLGVSHPRKRVQRPPLHSSGREPGGVGVRILGIPPCWGIIRGV